MASLLKQDVSLFSHLYIVMQHRTSDMSTFSCHENHPFPLSLADGGKYVLGRTLTYLILLPQMNKEQMNSYNQHTHQIM